METEEFEDDDTFIVTEHTSLETARKYVCFDTGLPFDSKEGQVSEWAMAYALGRFKIGEEITFNQLGAAINEGLITQQLNKLIDLGLVDAIWDEKQGEVVFKAKNK